MQQDGRGHWEYRLLTKLMVTIRSCCWCLCPFFVFLPPLTAAAFGWVFTCPFWAVGGFCAGFCAVFVCPPFWLATGVFCPACPFWLTWPPPSAGLLRAWNTNNSMAYDAFSLSPQDMKQKMQTSIQDVVHEVAEISNVRIFTRHLDRTKISRSFLLPYSFGKC